MPHFEKMLTDQALLSRAYLHAWQATGQAEYLGVVTETLDFVLRDLSTPEGALYSSFDADAGGIEGAHATFTLDELRHILPAVLVGPTAEWYGITEHGNWEGRSIPVRPVGAPLERPPEIEEARALLAAARAERVQPARDEKVLTEWNAMTAATLAEVASATGMAHYGRRAEEICEFLWKSMYADGRLMRSWQGGRARHLAVAADYAWLVEAYLRLSEWTGTSAWRERALGVASQLLDLFWDDASGGFFTTGSDAEALVVRPKEFFDGAVPAANSIAVTALLRANALADDVRIEEAVDRTISLARPLLERHPAALADLVAALPMWSRPPRDRRHGRPAGPAGRGPPPLAPGRRRGLGPARRRAALRGAPVRAGTGLCMPCPLVPDAGRGRRDAGRPIGGARRMSENVVFPEAGDGNEIGNGSDDESDVVNVNGDGHAAGSGSDLAEERVDGAEATAAGAGGTRTSTRAGAGSSKTSTDPARLLRRSARRKERVPTAGGSTLHLLVLSSTREDTTVVDLATRTVMRVRVPWPEGHEPDIGTFDVVEVTLADDPERDDLAQPEATTVADLPRHVGTLRGRHLRKLLRRLVASPDGPLLGFPGPSAPYWEFRGFRPSVALIEPTRRPQLIRRQADGTTWVRFGWDRDDVWLPVEDRNAARALDAARRERLSGKSLSTALGFEPQYLLVTVSPPRDGHCYKVCAAVLPRG